MNALYGQWNPAIALLSDMNRLMNKNLSRATKRNALYMRDQIVLTIRNGHEDWEELKPATIARKGSSKPLIHHGDLMGSITDVEVGYTEFFIGVLRGVTSRDGTEMVNIAAVHEFGSDDGTIPMRSYIHSTLNREKEVIAQIWISAARDAVFGRVYHG
jgi:phage gpG-like protein